MNGLDILKRAKELIEKNHKFDYEFCPWCAIAEAKSQLDEEHGVNYPYAELIGFLGTGIFKELPQDKPLLEARDTLDLFNDLSLSSLTKKRCLEILQKAISLVLMKEKK